MSETTAALADTQESLEAVIKGEVLRMYQEVADQPEGEFHFYHGREAAEMFGYDPEWLDRAPAGAVASFAGVGNPSVVQFDWESGKPLIEHLSKGKIRGTAWGSRSMIG